MERERGRKAETQSERWKEINRGRDRVRDGVLVGSAPAQRQRLRVVEAVNTELQCAGGQRGLQITTP